ncbi:hypothetical protein WAI453_013069 [Rhynchosporium graminicola]
MDDVFRLATLIVKMNKDFSKIVHKEGFTRAFNGSLGLSIPDELPDDATAHSSVQTSGITIEALEYPELRSIMAQAEARPEPAEDSIMKWIAYKYNRSKEFKVSTTNPSLLPSLFAEQSRA